MGKGHQDKIAVITGAATGIGQRYAVRLAEEGVDIAVADIGDAAETVSLVEKAGRTARGYLCDVTSPESVAAMAESAMSDFGRCDILINNAGIYPNVPFEDISFDDWRRVMSINLDSLFLTAKQFVPGMKERGWGRVVNVSSSTLATPVTGYVHYVSSKGGVVGFTRALASDLAPHGITVNAVSPSLVPTTGTTVTEPRTQERFQMIANFQAIKQVQQADDVVGTVAFLTSDDATFVTGQTIYVDGGWVRA
ncbi:MAG: SDR family oxidoreductase [Pseudomonadota bacterium]|nr:SDR family oxidoreductase [Pseudomonadota bacterium]